MRYAILVTQLLAAGVVSGVASASDEPRAVAEAFCSSRLANDETATLALLTPSLLEAIEEANARNEIIAKETPDEKPPLGDGIPYQAFPDTAGGCEIGDVVHAGGNVEIKVTYKFADAPDAGWTDRLALVKEGDRLLIDDVIYANVANGEPDYGLRRALFDAFDQ